VITLRQPGAFGTGRKIAFVIGLLAFLAFAGVTLYYTYWVAAQ